MNTVIDLKNIDFSYGRFKAIDDITLSVDRGIFGLLGPNGAGKTTLMKILLGFLFPEQGKGSVLGYDIKENCLEIKKRIGYMPEIDCLLPGMNGIELITYLGELNGMPKQEAIKRAHEVLYYVGLEESRYRLGESYSSGMRQKLKLAASLVHDPELLFLDEPTSGMDPQARKDMLELIKDISRNKKMNMIISSHILADVEATCREVFIMNKGKIISQQKISSLNKGNFNIFEMKLTGETEKFRKKFTKHKIEQDDKGIFRIHLPVDFPRYSLFKAAVDSNVQIRHFRESKVTLEDAFVIAIGEADAD